MDSAAFLRSWESGPGLFSHSMAGPGLYISSGPSAGPRREWVQLLSLGKAGDGMMKAEGGNRTPEAMLGRSLSFSLLCPAGRSD